jgi:hypothetical protein
MCLQFGFVIFWQKAFGTKAALKMLVKLTPGLAIAEKDLIPDVMYPTLGASRYAQAEIGNIQLGWKSLQMTENVDYTHGDQIGQYFGNRAAFGSSL